MVTTLLGLLNSFPCTFSLEGTSLYHMGGAPGEMVSVLSGPKTQGNEGHLDVPPFPRSRLVAPVPDSPLTMPSHVEHPCNDAVGPASNNTKNLPCSKSDGSALLLIGLPCNDADGTTGGISEHPCSMVSRSGPLLDIVDPRVS